MAMRRRIKVGVNLTAAKRKPKTEPTENLQDAVEKNLAQTIKSEMPTVEPPTSKHEETTHFQPKVVPKIEPTTETPTKNDATFKQPAKVEFSRSNSYTAHVDENHATEIDDGVHVMQMDLQRTTNGFPMSPSKTQQRQRIKPTPIFGQRRNSLVGPATPTSPLQLPIATNSEDAASGETTNTPPRRERHYSGSQAPAYNHAASNRPSHGTGRTRTESTCSVFSDSHMSTTSKSRKHDEHDKQRGQARRDFEARFSNGVPDKSSLKMFDLIYYNPATNPMELKPKIEEIKTEAKEEEKGADAPAKEDDGSAVPVPQLKLNAKGELILDDKSLEIETTAEQEARKVLAKSSLIYLDENTGMNGFYKRQKRTRDWAPEETIRFYRCLQTIGTDFSMMCQLFPNRTRRDLKLKFKKEERCNGALINKALLHPNSFKIQELKDQFETEDREREEAERAKKLQKSIQYKKVKIRTSRAARALKNAEDIYNQDAREVEAKKKKRQRKPKQTNNDETEKAEKPKKKRQTKKSNEEKVQEPTFDSESYDSSSSQRVKEEPLCESMQQQTAKTAPHNQAFSSPFASTETQETITPDAQPPGEVENIEYVDILPVDEFEYSTHFDYMDDDFDETQEEYEYISETDAAAANDSRTYVNLDSGNVTHIRDTQATYNNAENVQFITSNEFLDTDIAANENSMLPLETQSSDFRSQEAHEEYDTMEVYETNERHETNTPQQSNKPNENVVMEQTENCAETMSAAAPTKSSTTQLGDETEIQKILEDIANGQLVVVSTYNPDAPDEQINEIYMTDRNTGELCDEPLDLPQELIESILSVMT